MIALLQRVSRAAVHVKGACIGEIDAGLLVLLCVERGDKEREAGRMLERILGYRVFGDGAGRLNLSLADAGGGLLLVPQFTLAADTGKGTRASLGRAAPPDLARELFEHVLQAARARHPVVAAGQFGANMQVSLTNDGPVTFWLETRPESRYTEHRQ